MRTAECADANTGLPWELPGIHPPETANLGQRAYAVEPAREERTHAIHELSAVVESVAQYLPGPAGTWRTDHRRPACQRGHARIAHPAGP